ncbi:probable chitinase 2 [Battus philenor]|uniref:probable chitinase 2 n=1 Tax=Battus philenor TaxID=42288 RepID=UPI0035D0C4A8
MGIKDLSLPLILATMSYVLKGQIQSGPTHGKVVVCYLSTWSIYREGSGKFKVTDVDPSLCTHVVYAFAGLDENSMTVKALDPGLDIHGKYENAGYAGLVALKKNYPHLKALLSIGGWNEGSLKFSNLAASPSSRETFIKSVLEFIDTYKFDGIDMHWKFPNVRDGKREDKANFVTLMKEIKEAFMPNGYILTTAIGAPKYVMEAAYELPQLNKYVDLMIVLAYDYHGTWDGVVGPNAPLKGYSKDDVFNVDYTLKYLLSHGVSPNKIVLGVPLFGRTFVLEKPETEIIEFGQTPAKSEGFQGPLTKENGFMGYNEICAELTTNDDKWTRHWHEQSSTPYLRNGDRIITYDNSRSLAVKVKKAMEYNLAGIMAYSIDNDDFSGKCDREPDYVSVSFSGLHNFVEKFNRIARNPTLQRLLTNLNLPEAQKLSTLSKSSEIAHKNHLWTTESKPSYPLLRAIDESITLAIEEKIIMTDMVSITNDKPAGGNTGVSTNSIFTVVCYFCFL